MPTAQRPDMAAYGVPDELDGVLDWPWASTRLERSRNYWVVTATAEGRPHALPVWGVWLPEAEVFVFSCADASRKARNIRGNARVVVTGEDTVEVVSVEGRATELEARDPLTADAFLRYAEKYEQDPAKLDEMVEFLRDNAAFVVSPERAFGIIERPDEFASRATRWVW